MFYEEAVHLLFKRFKYFEMHFSQTIHMCCICTNMLYTVLNEKEIINLLRTSI